MRKELFLMRHAKSDWTVPCSDYDRPLNQRGQRQSMLIGQWMRQHHLSPDCIISSPSVRTRETAMNICDEIDFNIIDVYWEEDLYHANHHVLLAVSLKFLVRYDKVMLLAHNPGMDDLLEYLCKQEELTNTAEGKLMTTASFARLELPTELDDIEFQSAGLLALVRPDELA
jgi:phosphohistidine phosphatase